MVAGGGATATASPGGHCHQGGAGGTSSRGCLASLLAISLPPVGPRCEATTLLPAAAARAASCRTAAATTALQLTGWVKVVVHFFSSPL